MSRLAPGWGRIALITLAVIAAVLLARILYPFGAALLLAAVLAAGLGPRFERLAVRLGGRRQLAAVLFTIAVAVLIVAPLVWILGLGLREAIEGSAALNDLLQRESPRDLVEAVGLEATGLVGARLTPDLQGQAESLPAVTVSAHL